MLTADRFHALADELAAASPADRAAILRLPKSAEPVTVPEAAELTGYPESTLLDYLRPSRRRRMGSKAIPPRREDGTWAAGELARWAARVPDGGHDAPPGRRGRPPVPPERITSEIRAIMAAGEDVTSAEAAHRHLAERGIHVKLSTVTPLWRAIRPQVPDPGPLPEPVRPDGLLTSTQLARWAAVTQAAITKAVERGNLTPAAWTRDDWIMREGRLEQRQLKFDVPLFDPARVKHPGGTRRTPVDKEATEGSET